MLQFPFFTNKVLKVVEENYRVKTIEIDHDLKNARPGQFIMVWIPGVGERPMSIGNSDPLTISVANVGTVSGKIISLKEGENISYRGPFGKEFTIPKGTKRILVIGGGYGVVPMFFLARETREKGIESIAVVGGRTEKDIIYGKRLGRVCKEVLLTTDDGSAGKKGNVMVEVTPLIESGKIDAVYCVGPERMMYAIATACKNQNVPCQVSVERYMKCGVGICGSCAIDGKLACIDGPVMSAKDALALSEFGKKHRDACGISKDY
ncbi:dihydroorotate dehydrogenase electron transfer subunit [Candidatus Micrarchaeota archaeon]|nr:dihydroorotate dehydrogenase electron transfer subunit [Candidatus Micrarchaeota archaeon]